MSRPLGIGILVNNLPADEAGGAQLQAVRMARELSRAHDVILFARGTERSAEGLRSAGFEIVLRDPPRVPLIRLAADIPAAVRQIDARRARLDALVCYQILSPGLIGAIARRPGLPMLLYVRGRTEYLPTSPYARRRIATFVLGRADRVLAQSETLRREIAGCRAGNPSLARRLAERTCVVPNGVEQRPLGARTGRHVVYVGRLIGLKGIDLLIEAMRGLPDAELVVAGDGPERERIRNLSAGLRVTFTGHVSHDAALRLIEQAGCLVLPSRTEAFSNVILEAMSFGIPVIATRVGGNVDLVESGVNGILVPPDDPAALRAAIRSVTTSDALRIELGNAGHRLAARYTWERAAGLLEDEIRRSHVSRLTA